MGGEGGGGVIHVENKSLTPNIQYAPCMSLYQLIRLCLYKL